LNGYHLVSDRDTATVDSYRTSPEDDLSFTSNVEHLLVERGNNPRSLIVDLRKPSHAVMDDARDPMLSADGQSVAFVRDEHGLARLMVLRAFQSDAKKREILLTPPSLNVYEASFHSETVYAFSATERWHPPQIYLTDDTHVNAPLVLGESRYPALSPDGRWLAYSHFEHGVWNLWIRDESTGAIRRVSDVPCNEIQPAWDNSSSSLLYGTDCGRSLWFTAVARRRVIP
jgi:Tol biopolymer transport system component